MKAMTYRGPYKVRVEEKPDPKIEHPNDAIVRVELAAICGSDLHLFHGMMPDLRIGHTFGHEFIGRVEQVGSSVQNLTVGDRVMVPFNIYCGSGEGFEPSAETFIGSVGATASSVVIQESPVGAYYRVAAVYGTAQSEASDAVTGTPCEGGPTGGTLNVKRNGPGTITFKNLTGDLTGATVTINGVGFTKAPKIKPAKGQIKQKGPLANGQTVAQACPPGAPCTVTVRTASGCSQITSNP